MDFYQLVYLSWYWYVYLRLMLDHFFFFVKEFSISCILTFRHSSLSRLKLSGWRTFDILLFFLIERNKDENKRENHKSNLILSKYIFFYCKFGWLPSFRHKQLQRTLINSCFILFNNSSLFFLSFLFFFYYFIFIYLSRNQFFLKVFKEVPSTVKSMLCNQYLIVLIAL